MIVLVRVLQKNKTNRGLDIDSYSHRYIDIDEIYSRN